MISLAVNRIVVARTADSPLFEPISFELAAGDICSIVGENGAGKSSLLSALMREVSPHAGSVEWSDSDGMIETLEPRVWWQAQEGFLFSRLSILENVLLALGHERREANIQWEPFDELYRIRRRKANELSGGERKMAAFLCAFNSNRDVWLLDEPAAGLSDNSTRKLSHILRDAAHMARKMVVVVEHDSAFVESVSDLKVVVRKASFRSRLTR